MNKIKKIFILFCLIICAPAFSKANIANSSVLRVCTTADYKPVLYTLPSGKFVGVAPDILNGFAHKEKLTVRYVVLSFNGLIPALISNKCDLIATGMAATDERKKVINFTLGIRCFPRFFNLIQ